MYFKKGSKHEPASFKPVSLICSASKIMEVFLNSVMQDHLESNDLLSKLQYGFRSNGSTKPCLLKFLSDNMNLISSKKDIDLT